MSRAFTFQRAPKRIPLETAMKREMATLSSGLDKWLPSAVVDFGVTRSELKGGVLSHMISDERTRPTKYIAEF